MSDAAEQTYFATFRVLLFLSVITCALWLLKFYWNNRNFYKMAARIPNHGLSKGFDTGSNFFGKSISEGFLQIQEYFKLSPEVFKFRLGYYLVVGISRPEDVEVVLNNAHSMEKSSFVEFTKIYMGNGLFSAPLDIWKKHRKLINPSFNQRILNSFIPIFAEKCDILIGILEEATGRSDIDITEILSRCTLDTICDTTMGLKVDAQTSPNRYGKLLERIMEIITNRCFNILYHSDIIFYMFNIGKELVANVGELNSFSRRVIKKRRELFEQKLRGEYIEDEGMIFSNDLLVCSYSTFCYKVIKKRRELFEQKLRGEYIEDEETDKIKTFLDRLMDMSYNGHQFTDQELQDEVNTFISAGSDTTAIALCYCCLTSGLFPEYQQKLYEEAIEVLGEDRYPTANDLPKLKFMEMFIKESLRIFPIAPLLVRITTSDIQNEEFVIPEGSVIMLGILHLHRNPKYWEDPLKFNPYRFLPEEWAKKHPYSYLPFSGGPRGCIGSRYAMMMMKLILSKLVRKFRIRTDYKSIEEVHLKINLMSRPSQGFKVSLDPRE